MLRVFYVFLVFPVLVVDLLPYQSWILENGDRAPCSASPIDRTVGTPDGGLEHDLQLSGDPGDQKPRRFCRQLVTFQWSTQIWQLIRNHVFLNHKCILRHVSSWQPWQVMDDRGRRGRVHDNLDVAAPCRNKCMCFLQEDCQVWWMRVSWCLLCF